MFRNFTKELKLNNKQILIQINFEIKGYALKLVNNLEFPVILIKSVGIMSPLSDLRIKWKNEIIEGIAESCSLESIPFQT